MSPTVGSGALTLCGSWGYDQLVHLEALIVDVGPGAFMSFAALIRCKCNVGVGEGDSPSGGGREASWANHLVLVAAAIEAHLRLSLVTLQRLVLVAR